MSAIRHSDAGPTTPLGSVTYGQVGILLELMLRGERTHFSKCDFCQSLNHRSATRCQGCHGRLTASYTEPASAIEDAAARRPLAEPRQVREFANLALWVLAMPLLLFVGFLLWQQAHGRHAAPVDVREARAATSNAAPTASGAPAVAAAVVAPPAAASVPSSEAQAVVSAPAALAAQAPVMPSATMSAAAAAEAAAVPMPADPAAVAEPLKPRPSRSRMASAAARAGYDPTAACEGESFFFRAICVNRRCAEAQNAHNPRCFDAVRQRRIDEARRNPTMMSRAGAAGINPV
jgi:hypothetical protein